VLGSDGRKHRWAYPAAKAIDEFLRTPRTGRNGSSRSSIVRFLNTVGPRQTGELRHGDSRRWSVRRWPASDHRVRRRNPVPPRFTHVGDVIGALIKLVNEPKAVGQVINIGTHEGNEHQGSCRARTRALRLELRAEVRPVMTKRTKRDSKTCRVACPTLAKAERPRLWDRRTASTISSLRSSTTFAQG